MLGMRRNELLARHDERRDRRFHVRRAAPEELAVATTSALRASHLLRIDPHFTVCKDAGLNKTGEDAYITGTRTRVTNFGGRTV